MTSENTIVALLPVWLQRVESVFFFSVALISRDNRAS